MNIREISKQVLLAERDADTSARRATNREKNERAKKTFTRIWFRDIIRIRMIAMPDIEMDDENGFIIIDGLKFYSIDNGSLYMMIEGEAFLISKLSDIDWQLHKNELRQGRDLS
jgi:hypothetical protein